MRHPSAFVTGLRGLALAGRWRVFTGWRWRVFTGWRWRVASWALFAVGAPPLGAQTPDAGPWATLAQLVEVDMTDGDGSARVRISYELGPAEAGAPLPVDSAVSFELLGFGDADVEQVLLDGGRRLVLWPATGSRRVTVVEPPFEHRGDALSMTFTYSVANVVEGTRAGGVPDPALHARIPVLTGPPVRATSGGEAFEARLSLPDAWAISEGFPSGLRPDGEGAYVVSLTVAPSIVGFRARTDGRRVPGFPLLVDALAILILVAFSAVGWRHLRSVAA